MHNHWISAPQHGQILICKKNIAFKRDHKFYAKLKKKTSKSWGNYKPQDIMTITFDGVSSRHKAILMCDGILEQNKWVTFWPCHPSWSWLMGSLDAVMRRTLPLSRRKRHFELIEGIHDHKILGDEAQYGFSHDVAYYVQPFLFLTLATNHIFLIHLKRVEYNASLTDRTDSKNMTEST